MPFQKTQIFSFVLITMLYEILITIAIIVVIILLLHPKKQYSTCAVNNINLDKIILHLRKQYQKMSLDKRIQNDICDNSDKLGGNRDYKKFIVGNNCEPWISRECIYILDHILPYNATGLEWSSGSSTIWLSYRLKSLISIEHTKPWSDIVKKVIMNKKLDKITKIYWIGRDELSYCNNERKYMTGSNKNTYCLKTYVNTNLIPNITYDYISVDGRARTGCLLRAIKLLKSENGILLLDNADRKRYEWSYSQIPSTWSRYDFWYGKELVSMWISHK